MIVQTDHAPIRHLPNQVSVNSRIWKWINILQGYDLEMRHISGKKNPADSLSRQHFEDACAQRREVKEEEEDMVRVLRVKPHATNEEIQDALSKIFSGRDTESESSSSSDQFKPKSKNSMYLIQPESETDTKRQSDGPEPTAQLSVLSSAVKLEQQLKDQIRSVLSTEFPYSATLNELESEREVTRVREKFRMQNVLLVGHFSGNRSTDESFWRIEVPDDQNIKATIMTELHSVPCAGHPGFQRTLQKTGIFTGKE